MVAIKESEGQFGVQGDFSAADASEASELLEKARGILKKKLSFFVWQGFFEPLRAVALVNGKLDLEAPTLFHRNWVVDHYMTELSSAVREVYGADVKIAIAFGGEAQKQAEQSKKKAKERSKNQPSLLEEIENERPKSSVTDNIKADQTEKVSVEPENRAPVVPIVRPMPPPDVAVMSVASRSNLNPSYSFESFVQGPSNQMGYAAALSVAEHPGAQFSPLFLFGGVGLGKTHLLYAIGQRAKEKDPLLKVVYLSAEQWVNSYIQSIRERQFDSFRNRYRNGCDILLIDDIQFLAGKDASQDEFFHTFNSLHEAKKQIVVTSDKYPHEIEGLEERLQTRLSWGLIADIRPPEIETRIAILHKKAQSLSVVISDEVLHFLAANVKTSVRELEGALVRVAACSAIAKHEITLQTTREILAPVLKKKNTVVTWQNICEVVASYYDLRVSELADKSRQKQVTFARQVAMHFCRSMLSLSLPEIGRVFGGRDHSTVLSSVRKIEAVAKGDVSFLALLNKLEARICEAATQN